MRYVKYMSQVFSVCVCVRCPCVCVCVMYKVCVGYVKYICPCTYPNSVMFIIVADLIEIA